MSGLPLLLMLYGGVGIFILALVYRTIKIARLPLNLRWELAPLPHEKGKNRYGGSYYEDYEWWTKPREKSHVNPLLYMAAEILLLRGIWERNRGLWPFSFAFHVGIYFITAMVFFVAAGALLPFLAVPDELSRIALAATSICAACGYLLGTAGSLGLFVKRIADADLKIYSTPSAYFNLALLVAAFTSGGYAYIIMDNYIQEMIGLTGAFFTASLTAQVSPELAFNLAVWALFLVYLPFSSMSHFIVKYFTYHDIRWDDTPAFGNPRLSKKMASQLEKPVGWSAVHVNANDSKSWRDAAGEEENK